MKIAKTDGTTGRNNRRVRPGRRRWLVLPLLSTVALVAGAGPAAAAETIQGSGAGLGFSTINVDEDPPAPGTPICLPGDPDTSQYIINVPAGTVAAAETSPDETAVYSGPLTVTITLTEPFFFGPAGVSTSPTCTPSPVDATIEVVSPDGLPPSVSCPADDGEFTRTNNVIAFTEAAELPGLDGECTVRQGVNEVTVSPVTHSLVGNEYPCFTDPFTGTSTCPPPLDQVHVQAEWTVTGADGTN